LVYHGTDGRVPWASATNWLHWPLLAAQYGSGGVQLFFVLSGFLISSILIDTAGKPDYYRKFYVRRALRILPAYLLILAVLKLDHVVSWRFILAAMLYIANMAGLVGARSGEYGALWSLAVEEQFYLVWPIIVRKLSLRSLTRLILCYYVFAFALRLTFLLHFPQVDLRYKLWFNADALMSGALIAISLRRDLLRRDNITGWIGGLAVAAIILWPLTVFLDVHHTATLLHRGLRAVSFYSQLATYCAFLLMVIRSNVGVTLHKPGPAVRLLTFFGYISYGLYLVHQLIFMTFDRWVRGTVLSPDANHPWALLLNTVICVTISTGIAYLSRRYFEDLFLRQKDKVVPYNNPAVNEKPVAETV
jgi:peptidoglycan/LPS O-acetylase OafA/YrhL